MRDENRLRRVALSLLLLGVAPVGSFLASYLSGAGALSEGTGLVLGAGFMLGLPWLISALFAAVAKVTWPIRVAIFVGTLAVQGGLIWALPPGATAQTMGFAHTVGRTLSSDDLRQCAARLRQQQQAGTLAQTSTSDGPVVDQADLPPSLRGRFVRVYLQSSTHPGGQQVVFELSRQTGIICDDRKSVSDFFTHSMAEGVHAYRYQRL